MLIVKWLQEECARKLRIRADYQNTWVKKNTNKKKASDSASHKKHRVSRLKKQREYCALHIIEAAARSKKYYSANRQKMIDNSARWAENNREKRNVRMRAWTNNRRGSDLNFRMSSNIRTRIWFALKRGTATSSRTLELIGCSVPEFRAHLEKRFKPGMTWENYGEWHVDHIRPCASFNLIDPEQQRRCFHFSNQQPLWEFENLSKGARYG